MAKKIDAKEFILQLLEEANCRGIHPVGKENFNCQCPFHRPKKNTTAFGISFVNEEFGYPFRCFSCGITGTIISLIVFLKKCSYKQAENIFYKRVLITPADTKTLKRKLKNIKYRMDESIDHKLKLELPKRSNKNKKMWNYLKERNEEKHHTLLFPEYLVGKYLLYYCNTGFYSRRIIMPIRDMDGTVIYLTNRAIDDNETRKTLHPPGFNNEEYVHGLYEAREKKKVIVVEGPFDMFQLVCGSLRIKRKDIGIISILGTEMNEERASIISDTFEEAYLLFDQDEAGWIADKKGKNILGDYMKVTSLHGSINRGKDPGSCNMRLLRRVFNQIAEN